jgi:peptidoglycan/LPS O-acetylase OafA/YrhL
MSETDRDRTESRRVGRNHNIDAVRLLAALQVLLVHFNEHVLGRGVENDAVVRILSVFPGVPIFFALSGYLIFASADRSASAREYAVKRFLRLYPGLWVCLGVSVALVWVVGYRFTLAPGELLPWVFAQATVLQSYNPEFLRGFGVGALNGSLWTIGVEVQFYLLAPVLLHAMRRMARAGAGWVVLVLVVLAGVNEVFASAKVAGQGGIVLKLLSVTVAPFLVYFLLGGAIYVYRLRDRLGSRRAFYFALGLHVLLCLGVYAAGGRYGGNYMHTFLGFTLTATVFCFAYLPEARWAKVLTDRDYSYSVYLYHMPVINAVLFLGLSPVAGAVATAVAVATLAGLSWHLVERPALRWGRAALSRPAVIATAG